MRRAAFVVAGALILAGCMEWQPRPVTVPSRAGAANLVRVTVERGARRLTLGQAAVRADTVDGVVVEAQVRRRGGWERDDAALPGDHVAFALRDVWALEERGTSGEGSVAVLLLVVGVGALAFFLFAVPYLSRDQ